MTIATKNPKHRKVFICSPYRPRGETEAERSEDLKINREMAKRACDLAVSYGYMPLAPHLYFTQFLSDDDPMEREDGIQFGIEWLDECDELWVIGNRITKGMQREIRAARSKGIPICSVAFQKSEMWRLLEEMIL